MDDIYRARLGPSQPGHIPPENDSNAIHIQPHPNPPPQPGHPVAQPVPIQLPNIYVNPYPPRPPTPPHQPPAVAAPAPVPPTAGVAVMPKTMKVGPWRLHKPHPLLWISLLLSLIALVLEVPKGSLPTITGRHKALRTQEKLVAERLSLLTQLSTFLPPPLSHLVSPDPSTTNRASVLALGDRGHLELLRPGALRFWNTHLGGMLGVGGDEERWWSVEELGQGSSVVRSRGEGKEREVWVIQTPGEDDKESTGQLLNALTHSLLLRDRLQAEIDKLRATPCPNCPSDSPSPLLIHGSPSSSTGSSAGVVSAEEDEHARQARAEEWERHEERKRREREREREVEEREREVARREKWVVEEMRKLSDKVHAQATELTLEDRITERLKAYQRQLAQLGHEQDPAV